MGGTNGTAAVSTEYTAPINSDGTLGTWTTGTNLPGPLYASQAVVTNSRVYVLGGYTGAYLSTVYSAPFAGGLNDYTNTYTGKMQIPNIQNTIIKVI